MNILNNGRFGMAACLSGTMKAVIGKAVSHLVTKACLVTWSTQATHQASSLFHFLAFSPAVFHLFTFTFSIFARCSLAFLFLSLFPGGFSEVVCRVMFTVGFLSMSYPPPFSLLYFVLYLATVLAHVTAVGFCSVASGTLQFFQYLFFRHLLFLHVQMHRIHIDSVILDKQNKYFDALFVSRQPSIELCYS